LKKFPLLYDHERVTQQLKHDWLGPTPMFDDDKFKLIFRISKDMFLMPKFPFIFPKGMLLGRWEPV
jgi:hypothetical protein